MRDPLLGHEAFKMSRKGEEVLKGNYFAVLQIFHSIKRVHSFGKMIPVNEWAKSFFIRRTQQLHLRANCYPKVGCSRTHNA